jgi:hypothetical protein
MKDTTSDKILSQKSHITADTIIIPIRSKYFFVCSLAKEIPREEDSNRACSSKILETINFTLDIDIRLRLLYSYGKSTQNIVLDFVGVINGFILETEVDGIMNQKIDSLCKFLSLKVKKSKTLGYISWKLIYGNHFSMRNDFRSECRLEVGGSLNYLSGHKFRHLTTLSELVSHLNDEILGLVSNLIYNEAFCMFGSRNIFNAHASCLEVCLPNNNSIKLYFN